MLCLEILPFPLLLRALSLTLSLLLFLSFPFSLSFSSPSLLSPSLPPSLSFFLSSVAKAAVLYKNKITEVINWK